MRSALAIGCLGVLVLAVPVQAGQRSESKVLTIRLVSKTVSTRALVDRAPKGEPSKGDVQQAKLELRNAVAQLGRPKGALIGTGVAVGTVTSLAQVHIRVNLTAKLPGGTIRAAGTYAAQRSLDVPVVGGTGAFADAGGTLRVDTFEPDARTALMTYRLRLP
jgi:dirigent-like protein